jgi:hypothetical protein
MEAWRSSTGQGARFGSRSDVFAAEDMNRGVGEAVTSPR